MELEDAYIAWLEGKPVPQLRHPRRTLRQWLTGRKPEPARAAADDGDSAGVARGRPGRDLMSAEYRICR